MYVCCGVQHLLPKVREDTPQQTPGSRQDKNFKNDYAFNEWTKGRDSPQKGAPNGYRMQLSTEGKEFLQDIVTTNVVKLYGFHKF